MPDLHRYSALRLRWSARGDASLETWDVWYVRFAGKCLSYTQSYLVYRVWYVAVCLVWVLCPILVTYELVPVVTLRGRGSSHRAGSVPHRGYPSLVYG